MLRKERFLKSISQVDRIFENILFGVQQKEINKKFPIFKFFGNVKEREISKKQMENILFGVQQRKIKKFRIFKFLGNKRKKREEIDFDYHVGIIQSK